MASGGVLSPGAPTDQVGWKWSHKKYQILVLQKRLRCSLDIFGLIKRSVPHVPLSSWILVRASSDLILLNVFISVFRSFISLGCHLSFPIVKEMAAFILPDITLLPPSLFNSFSCFKIHPTPRIGLSVRPTLKNPASQIHSSRSKIMPLDL